MRPDGAPPPAVRCSGCRDPRRGLPRSQSRRRPPVGRRPRRCLGLDAVHEVHAASRARAAARRLGGTRTRGGRTRAGALVRQGADARRPQPLAAGSRRYPAVVCCFCPDSITADLDEWRRCTEHVASLVAPGGWFVLTALGGADSYRVGARRFPSPGVSVDDVADVLRSAGFSRLGTTITSGCDQRRRRPRIRPGDPRCQQKP